jgi:hypothetical protein
VIAVCNDGAQLHDAFFQVVIFMNDGVLSIFFISDECRECVCLGVDSIQTVAEGVFVDGVGVAQVEKKLALILHTFLLLLFTANTHKT